jgi:polyphosphate kinase
MSTPLRKEAEVREFPKKITTGPLATTAAPLYFNRELSLLEFHARVFEEAMDPSNPLLERLKFLGIFASNLDEFFMIRVSGLKEELEQSVTTLSPDGMTPADQLSAIKRRLLPLLGLQEEWTKRILNELRDKGLVIASFESLSRWEKEGLKEYFTEIVFPVLTPLAVDPSHPFPYISPSSLNIGVMVDVLPDSRTGDPKLDEPRFVRIKVPSEIIPRLVPVGSDTTKFVLLEELIAAHVDMLFPGMKAGECHRFRVTRDADIEIREEEAQDLLGLIQEELRQRRFGTPVRLEVSSSMPPEMVNYLSSSLELDADYVYRNAAPLAAQDLSALYDLDRPELKDTAFEPTIPDWFTDKRSIFDVIQESDRLLHHPFDSYDCVT